jgi:hypothetical protein
MTTRELRKLSGEFHQTTFFGEKDSGEEKLREKKLFCEARAA